MSYHPILNNQLRKYLPEGSLSEDAILVFLEKVSNTYYSFEKSQKIADHAFSISEKEYQEVNASLIRSKEIAEEASIAKSQFLSTMSHEIRTPLNAVIGFTQLLQKANNDPVQAEYLKLLSFSAQNLLMLINDILDFNKIEAGKIALDETDFDIKELLNNICGALIQSAVEKGIKLELVIDPLLPEMLCGDSGRLGQVFINLISNAIKFTSYGKVSITASTVEIGRETTTVHFAIADTGIGIEVEKQKLIFERFTQANEDTTRKYGGTGLGLSISKKLLSLMHSEIDVKSDIGVGSVFSFVIDFKKCTKPAINTSISKTKIPDETKSLRGLRILVAEDNPINLMIVKRFLTDWGIVCDDAENGKIALEKAGNNHYDIILMDLQMPEMDGYQSAKEIRLLPGSYYQDLPIIAFTASALIETKEKITELGMNDYLNKPFNHIDLYNKIFMYAPKVKQ